MSPICQGNQAKSDCRCQTLVRETRSRLVTSHKIWLRQNTTLSRGLAKWRSFGRCFWPCVLVSFAVYKVAKQMYQIAH